MKKAVYEYGRDKPNNKRIEKWSIWENNAFVSSTQIEFDRDWFVREGSINDLKAMALGA